MIEEGKSDTKVEKSVLLLYETWVTLYDMTRFFASKNAEHFSHKVLVLSFYSRERSSRL